MLGLQNLLLCLWESSLVLSTRSLAVLEHTGSLTTGSSKTL